MNPLLLEVLSEWPDRWRYPQLVSALALNVAPLGSELLTGLLDGIAAPVASLTESVRRLCDAGHIDIAAVMVMSVPAGSRDLADARAVLEREEESAAHGLRDRWRDLAERARRAGVQVEDPPWSNSERSPEPAEAEAALENLRRSTLAAEERCDRDLEALLATVPEADAAWLARVRACKAAREWRAAKRLVEAGPDKKTLAGPSAIPRAPDTWPWPDRRLVDVLRWYREEPLETPSGFLARWRPSEDDLDAWNLVDAIAALVRETTDRTVRDLADALDALFDARDVDHEPEVVSEGYQTSLLGLYDARLARLGLPDEVPLWMAGPELSPPDETARPVLWLVLGAPPEPAPPGVVLLPLTALLPLVAPTADGRPAPRDRRINFLRAMCKRLSPTAVLNASSELVTRRDLLWALDLLQVSADDVAVEVLLDETGGKSGDIATAMEWMTPAGSRLAHLTHDAVVRWRWQHTKID